MKNVVSTFCLLLLGLFLTLGVNAQIDWKEADAGFRFGTEFEGSAFGFFAEQPTGEGKSFNVGCMFLEGSGYKLGIQYKLFGEGDLADVEGLNYYYGAGPAVARYGSFTSPGLEAVLGGVFRIPETPFVLALEWKPGAFMYNSDVTTYMSQIGLMVGFKPSAFSK